MDYRTVKRKATEPNGLSANFIGKFMGTLINKKPFSFTLTNKSEENITFALIQGALPNLEELQKRYPEVDAILYDGDFVTVGEGANAKKVTCKCKTFGSIAFLQEYFKTTPGFIRKMDISTDDRENFNNDIQYGAPNPCVVVALDRIPLSDYLGTDQYDQGRIKMENLNIPFNGLSVVFMTIAPKSKMDIQLTLDTKA